MYEYPESAPSPEVASPLPQAQDVAQPNPDKILRNVFGYSSFRPHQREIIDAVLAGRDVLAVMPTSAGKSICYQVPALARNGITIVISPLIALMADQVSALSQLNIPAAFLNSSLSARERSEVLFQVRTNKLRLLYLAPERLDDGILIDAVKSCGVALVAVDEAHCISQWGNDFRPSYQRIARFVEALGARPPICALTATATHMVQRDITASLHLNNPLHVVASFDRPNLYFSLANPKSERAKLNYLVAFIRKQQGASGIVYCLARRTVEELCEALRKEGISAARYHAKLSAAERDRAQTDFIYDRVQVIVATNAFGMGIDKPDVSFVVHYNIPLSMEAYYQEAGRAGRDGMPATCLLLYSPKDVHTAQFLINRTDEDKVELTKQEAQDLIAHRNRRLQDIVRYATSTECLRRQVLNHFGEDAPNSCTGCSNCKQTWDEVDRSIWALKIVSCVARLNQRQLTLGATMVCQILRGSHDQRILSRGLNTLSTYGILSDASDQEIRELIDVLVARNILGRTEGAYPVLTLTDRSGTFLREVNAGRDTFVVRVPHKSKSNARSAQNKKKRTQASRGNPQPRGVEQLSTKSSRQKAAATQSESSAQARDKGADGLSARLKSLRRELAFEQDVPAYIIFTNATLEDLCHRQPRTREELLQVSGIGSAKADRYGSFILNEITRYLEEAPLGSESQPNE